jgi:patatin-like phospholipase/acyl hydrolase
MLKFTALCDQAFTPRELHEVHGVRVIVKLRHGSKYKTTPLHKALRTAFGEQYLFGGKQDSDTAYMTKVAVTTTSGPGQTPIIITNYGRQDNPQVPYKLEFSRGSHIGLKVWHAACATSAAPSIFKPFKHPETERSYMDGGLYYNNPVKIANHERRLLWPDVAESHPDIMLSIGTGQNLQETEVEMECGTKSKSDAEKRKDAKSYGKLGAKEVKKLKSRRLQLFNNVKNV